MWDPRYGDYAAEQLAGARDDAATVRLAGSGEAAAPGRRAHRTRATIGRLFLRVGERLVAQPVRP